MDIDIDGILINIEGSSTDAESSIDRTINTLKELRNAASSAGTGLNTLKVRFDALGNIKGVTATLKAASEEAKKQKADYSSLADEISNISKRFASLTPEARKAATQAAKAADALRSLSGKKYSPDASSAASMLKDLSSSMSGMVSTKSQIDAVSTAFSKLPPNIRKVITANSQLETSNTKTSKSFALYAAKATIIVATLRSIARVINNFIEESNDYVENLNLFTVAMGEYADQSQKYAETVGDVMGIDPSDWMRNQGVFMTLATGFGVVSDRAEIMSRNLTQLGYDLSSFFNISVEDAMQKLQSGISGELEPLRRLGYDLSQARLEAVALSLGIDQSVTSMNQAQKAQLRYYTIMTQVTQAQGDMARTLEAPANQLRIFQAQLTQAARAIGNIFIPALNAVLPYANAFVKVIRWIASEIANLFGFSLPEVDYSGISSVGSSFDDVADAADGATSAAKELKGTLAGFDEINLIAQETGGGGSGSGGSSTGSDFGFELPQYDFLGDAIGNKINDLANQFKRWIPIIKDVGAALLAAFAGTKLLKGLNNLLNALGLNGLTGWLDKAKQALIGFTFGFSFGALSTYVATMIDAKDGTIGWSVAIDGLVVSAGIALSVIGAINGSVSLVAAGLGILVGAIVGVSEAFAQMRKEQVESAFYDGLGVSITELADKYVALTNSVTYGNDAIIQTQNAIETGLSSISSISGEIDTLLWSVDNGVISIQEALPKITESFNQLEDDTRGILDNIYNNVIRALSGSIGDAYVQMGGNMDEALGVISDIVGSTNMQLDSLMKELEDVTSQLNSGIGDKAELTKRLEELKQSIASLVQESSPELVGLQQEIKDIFSEGIDWESPEKLRDALDSVAKSSSEAKESIKDTTNSIITDLETLKLQTTDAAQISILDSLIEAVENDRDTKIAEINDIYKSFAETVSSNLVLEMETQFNSAVEKWDSMSFFEKWWYGDKDAYVKEILTTYRDEILNPAIDEIKEANNGIGEEIAEETDSIVDNIMDALFQTEVLQGGSKAGIAITKMRDDIEKIINDEFQNANWDIGSSIPDGIAKGIDENKSIATDAASGLATSAISAFAEAQQSNSPAKKYIEQALYAVQGFAAGIEGNAQLAYDAIRDFGENLIDTLHNAIESSKGSVRSSMENLFAGVNIKVPSFSISGDFSLNPPSVPKINVRWYASGGFPEMGDLFIANDAGPELVGTINGRTAVANNDQIVEGIALGVASAQEEQNALLREQNSLLRQLLSKEGTVVFPTSVEAGRAVQRALNMYNIARGVT